MPRIGSLRLDRDVEGLIRVLENGEDLDAVAAAESLGDLHALQAVPALMAALERGPYSQYGAAEALGKLGDPRAVPALISVVARGDYANAVAAIALGVLGDPSAIACIADALAGSGSADRAKMAKALTALGARDALLRIAADDGPTSGMLSRWPAAMELARLGDARVVDVLISMPMDVEEVEIEALDVLGRLADSRGLPFVLQRAGSVTQVVTFGSSGPYSQKRTWRQSDNLRLAAVEALGQIADIGGLFALLDALGSEHPPVRGAAAAALAAVPAAYPWLLAALEDCVATRRAGACDSLCLLKNSAAAAPLCMLLSHEKDPQVRVAAATALGAFPELGSTDELACEFAQQLKTSDNGELRAQLAGELGLLRVRTIVPALLVVLKDDLPGVRRVAIQALTGLADGRAVVPLIEVLHDESAAVRAQAARALGTLRSADAVSPLIELLRDSSEEVAAAAAESLGQLGNLAAVAPLWEARTRPSRRLRRVIAGVLGELLARTDAAALYPLLEDTDPQVQLMIIGVLTDHRALAYVRRLTELTETAPLPVALAAVRALGEIADPDCLETLQALYTSATRPWELRPAAVDAIGRIQTPEATRILATVFEQHRFPDALHHAARVALVARGS